MRLGRLIEKLEKCSAEAEVYFDFGWFRPDSLHSWRGDYSQLAIGYTNEADAPTVGTLTQALKAAIGKTFQGYKGGDFVMDETSVVWVENYGDGNHTTISDVTELDYGRVIIDTKYRDI